MNNKIKTITILGDICGPIQVGDLEDSSRKRITGLALLYSGANCHVPVGFQAFTGTAEEVKLFEYWGTDFAVFYDVEEQG